MSLHEELVKVLGGHLSTIGAQAMVARACGRCGIERNNIRPEHLEALVPELRRSIGLFCADDKRTALMLDLAEFIERCTPHEGRRR